MKVTTTLREDHQAELTLVLDSQEMARAKRRVAREYARRMKIPGFRPGKAPYEIVARRVGEAAIREEALERLLDEYYPKALEEAGIEPYGPGELQEIVSDDPPTFKLLVPLAVDVDLGDYRNVRLPYEPPELADEEVEKALNAYRQLFAVLEPVDRPAEVGDVVYVNVEAYEEGREDGEPLFADQNHPVLIEEEPHEGEWPYPGFPEEFVGAQAGDKKTLTYTYPDDEEDETLRGQTVVVKAEVTEVKARSVPELDDELARQLGAEDAEDLRKGVRESLVQQKQTAYDENYLMDALDAIVAQATLKYPPQAVEAEVDDRLDEYRREARQRGLSWEAYLKERGTDEETLRAELRQEVEPFVRRRLVLEAIVAKEEMEVDADRVMQSARDYLVRMAASMERKEARKLGRDKAFIHDLVTAAAHDDLMEQAETFVIALAKGELEARDEAGEADAAQPPEAGASSEAGEGEAQAEAAEAPSDAGAQPAGADESAEAVSPDEPEA